MNNGPFSSWNLRQAILNNMTRNDILMNTMEMQGRRDASVLTLINSNLSPNLSSNTLSSPSSLASSSGYQLFNHTCSPTENLSHLNHNSSNAASQAYFTSLAQGEKSSINYNVPDLFLQNYGPSNPINGTNGTNGSRDQEMVWNRKLNLKEQLDLATGSSSLLSLKPSSNCNQAAFPELLHLSQPFSHQLNQLSQQYTHHISQQLSQQNHHINFANTLHELSTQNEFTPRKQNGHSIHTLQNNLELTENQLSDRRQVNLILQMLSQSNNNFQNQQQNQHQLGSISQNLSSYSPSNQIHSLQTPHFQLQNTPYSGSIESFTSPQENSFIQQTNFDPSKNLEKTKNKPNSLQPISISFENVEPPQNESGIPNSSSEIEAKNVRLKRSQRKTSNYSWTKENIQTEKQLSNSEIVETSSVAIHNTDEVNPASREALSRKIIGDEDTYRRAPQTNLASLALLIPHNEKEAELTSISAPESRNENYSENQQCNLIPLKKEFKLLSSQYATFIENRANISESEPDSIAKSDVIDKSIGIQNTDTINFLNFNPQTNYEKKKKFLHDPESESKKILESNIVDKFGKLVNMSEARHKNINPKRNKFHHENRRKGLARIIPEELILERRDRLRLSRKRRLKHLPIPRKRRCLETTIHRDENDTLLNSECNSFQKSFSELFPKKRLEKLQFSNMDTNHAIIAKKKDELQSGIAHFHFDSIFKNIVSQPFHHNNMKYYKQDFTTFHSDLQIRKIPTSIRQATSINWDSDIKSNCMISKNSISHKPEFAPINNLAISNDGRMLVSVSSNGVIRLWDISSPILEDQSYTVNLLIEMRDLSHDVRLESIHEYYCVSFSPCDTSILVGGKMKSRYKWDTNDGDNEILPCPLHVYNIMKQVEAVKNNELTKPDLILEGHLEEILCLTTVYYSNVFYVLTGSYDGTVIRWKMNTNFTELEEKTQLHNSYSSIIFGIEFIPDTFNRYFLTASDNYIRLYDFEEMQLIKSFETSYTSYCDYVRFVPKPINDALNEQSTDNHRRIYYLISHGVESTSNGVLETPNKAVLHKLIIDSKNDSIDVEEVRKFDDSSYSSNAWLIQPGLIGNFVLYPGSNGKVYITNILTGELTTTSNAHYGQIRQILPDPFRNRYFTCGDDGEVNIFIYKAVPINNTSNMV